LERHPQGVVGLSSHVWLPTQGQVRSVHEDRLDFSDEG
jgi:hypothetical protein